jgi:hypothetical protein
LLRSFPKRYSLINKSVQGVKAPRRWMKKYTHRYRIPMTAEASDPFTLLGIPHAQPAILSSTGKIPSIVA